MISVGDFKAMVSNNNNFRIDRDTRCPIPPTCDKSQCPPGHCEQKLHIEKIDTHGLYMISVRYPNAQINPESIGYRTLIKAGFKESSDNQK